MSIKPTVFKQVRKALGLTQQELADNLGLSRVTVNKMEQGRLKRGIPDDVGAKLLALKAGEQAEANAAKTLQNPVNVNYTREHELSVAFQEAGDDQHLWDNEEED